MSALALPAKLTLQQACSALQALEPAVVASGSQAVVVDASALADFDSAALAVLLECRRAALDAGKTLSVQGAPQTLVALAGLYGVAELLALDQVSA